MNEKDKDQEAADAHERLLPEKVPPKKVPTGGDGCWRAEAVATALEMSSTMHIEAGSFLAASILRHRPGSAQVHVTGGSRKRAAEVLGSEESGRVQGLRVLIRDAYRWKGWKQEPPSLMFGWYAFSWEGEHVEMAVAPLADMDRLIFFSDSARAAEEAAAFVEDRIMRPQSRCLEYSFGSWADAPRMDEEIGKISWDDIVLPEETLVGVRRSSERFFEKREDYERMGFPWKRGLLLVGPPGTGKTMMMKAVARSVTDAKPEVPFLYVQGFDGEGGSARDIVKVFRRARELAPCILAFEDIDGLVDDSNRSMFLNQLDGFEENDGLFVLASSNHPERIDEALLKRPSRFDRVFHVSLPALPERIKYLTKLLSGPLFAERFRSSEDTGNAASVVAEASEGLTPAHLKEAAISAALALTHEEGPEKDKDGADGAGFEDTLLDQVKSLRAYLRSARLPEELGEIKSPREHFGF